MFDTIELVICPLRLDVGPPAVTMPCTKGFSCRYNLKIRQGRKQSLYRVMTAHLAEYQLPPHAPEDNLSCW